MFGGHKRRVRGNSTMRFAGLVSALLLVATAVAGCGAALPGYRPPSPKSEKIKEHTPTGGGYSSGGTYTLNDQELNLDCKKLTGSIQVTILQLREADSMPRRSSTAKATETVVSPLMGGPGGGMDPDTAIARSRARVKALNARLAEKNCPTFDLDAELTPGKTDTPVPIKPTKGK